jgi:ApaG protein
MAFVNVSWGSSYVSYRPRPSRCTANRPSAGPSACASSPTTRTELWRSVAALRESLACAVDKEQFSDAARLRDEIEVLTLTDDYVRVHRLLDQAVAEQRFLDAATLRDELAQLSPPPSLVASSSTKSSSRMPKSSRSKPGVAASSAPAPSTSAVGLTTDSSSGVRAADAPTSTECVTDGIVVAVGSFHMPEHDCRTPGEAMIRYTFGYRVRITNTTSSTVQLIARHWVIENASGPESEVRGSGVVGRQPVLEPGESFEYTSACPLTCKMHPGMHAVGNMRGEYTLVRGETGMEQFTVQVGRFYFVLPEN